MLKYCLIGEYITYYKDISRNIYLEGPSKISLEEKSFIKQDIGAKYQI